MLQLRAISLLLVFAASGCLGPPDTFGDMQQSLNAIQVPADFTRVDARRGGLRSRFAAAPGPSTEYGYSAPWDSGELCRRIESLVSKSGPPLDSNSGRCGYHTRIPSGWPARLVNVWDYELLIYAVAPEDVAST